MFQKNSTGGGCYDLWEEAVMPRKFGIIEAPLLELKKTHYGPGQVITHSYQNSSQIQPFVVVSVFFIIFVVDVVLFYLFFLSFIFIVFIYVFLSSIQVFHKFQLAIFSTIWIFLVEYTVL